MIDDIKFITQAQYGNEGWKVRFTKDGVLHEITLTDEEKVYYQTKLAELLDGAEPVAV